MELGEKPQEEDPPAEHPSASTPARAGQITPPEPEGPVGRDAAGPACSAQGEAQGGPKPEAGVSMPSSLHEQQGLGDARNTDRRPQGIRAFLGLGPGGPQPHGQPGAAMKAGKAGKPAKAKAKRAPNGPTRQRTRKSASLQAPSSDRKGHIQHWLARRAIGNATTPDGTRGSPGEPHGQAPETCMSVSGCDTGVQPASWRSPGFPGSSTDPPQVAAARVPAISPPSPQEARVRAREARRGPGGPTRRAAGAAGSAKRIGGDRPPGGPGSVLSRARSVTMEALPRLCASFRICLCLSPGGRATGPSPAWQEG